MSALSLNVIRRRISGPTAGAWIALAGAAFGGIWAWHGGEKAQLFSAVS